MKRKLFILSILAICLAIVATGSLAYYTAEGKAHNIITTGNVEIEVREWTEGGKPFQNLEGILPGMRVTKIAEVENTGGATAWIRVKLTKSILLKVEDVTPDTSLVELNLNLEDWTQAEDGYLYYNDPVDPGEKTEPIFTHVTFNKTMGNEYQNATATVEVYAQAVQNFKNGTTALEATGWPLEEKL